MVRTAGWSLGCGPRVVCQCWRGGWGKAGLTTGSVSAAPWGPQRRDGGAILGLTGAGQPPDTSVPSCGRNAEAGVSCAARDVALVLSSCLTAGVDSAGSSWWEERSEELGCDPVPPRVLIPRGPRSHKLEGPVVSNATLALAPQGDEPKAEGHGGEEGEEADC